MPAYILILNIVFVLNLYEENIWVLQFLVALITISQTVDHLTLCGFCFCVFRNISVGILNCGDFK